MNKPMTHALAGVALMLGASLATAAEDTALDGLAELGVLPPAAVAMTDAERDGTRGAVRAGFQKKCIFWKACVWTPYFKYVHVTKYSPSGKPYLTYTRGL